MAENSTNTKPELREEKKSQILEILKGHTIKDALDLIYEVKCKLLDTSTVN